MSAPIDRVEQALMAIVQTVVEMRALEDCFVGPTIFAALTQVLDGQAGEAMEAIDDLRSEAKR